MGIQLFAGSFGKTMLLAEIKHLINYLFKYGPEPPEAGDANSDGRISISDVVYLVNYLYRNGDPPR